MDKGNKLYALVVKGNFIKECQISGQADSLI